jgi:hypothetical protein
MRRLIALSLAVALVVGLVAPAARAGTATDVALGLASFAVFNQLAGPFLSPRPVYARLHPVVVQRPVVVERPVYYAQPVVVHPLPPPTYQTVIQYPNGRYELRGDGIRTAYHWVWIPNVPLPPPPPPQY